MRYLCLVYGTEDSLPVMQNPNPISIAEVDALTQDSLAYNDMLRASGHFIVAHALRSVRTATTVRVRGGKVLVTDGPFAETKEQLLGFVLIEAKDHHEAVEVWRASAASRCAQSWIWRDRPAMAWLGCRIAAPRSVRSSRAGADLQLVTPPAVLRCPQSETCRF
jgi:hypothetical protein